MLCRRRRRPLGTPVKIGAAIAVVLGLAACTSPTPPSAPVSSAATPELAPGPGIPFAAVALPAGAVPEVLTTDGGTLFVGVRRPSAAIKPGVLLRSAQGTFTEVPVRPSTPYGTAAHWYSITSSGGNLVAVGGERGGAHANTRWSVWTGSVPYVPEATTTTSPAGTASPDPSASPSTEQAAARTVGSTATAPHLSEQTQAFSTFGGNGAGELIDAVATPAGAVLVGSWQSDVAGYDIARWLTDGTDWSRQNSTGTPLGSTAKVLNLPMAATGDGKGVLVAGWQVALDAGSRQVPAVWRSSVGDTGWTATRLSDGGRPGAAVAVRCVANKCAVVGRLGGQMALWTTSDETWARVSAPRIPVGERDHMVAPVMAGDRLVQFVADGDHTAVAIQTAAGWSVRKVTGPSGTPIAAATVGSTLYLVVGTGEATRSLWSVDLKTLS